MKPLVMPASKLEPEMVVPTNLAADARGHITSIAEAKLYARWRNESVQQEWVQAVQGARLCFRQKLRDDMLIRSGILTAFILPQLILASVLQKLERGAFKPMAEVGSIVHCGKSQVAGADQPTS